MKTALSAISLFCLLGRSVTGFQSLSNRPACRLATEVYAQNENSRRTFVTGSVAATIASLGWPYNLVHAEDSPVAAAASSSVDYKAVASDIMDLVKKNPDWGPSEFACLFFSLPLQFRLIILTCWWHLVCSPSTFGVAQFWNVRQGH